MSPGTRVGQLCTILVQLARKLRKKGWDTFPIVVPLGGRDRPGTPAAFQPDERRQPVDCSQVDQVGQLVPPTWDRLSQTVGQDTPPYIGGSVPCPDPGWDKGDRVADNQGQNDGTAVDVVERSQASQPEAPPVEYCERRLARPSWTSRVLMAVVEEAPGVFRISCSGCSASELHPAAHGIFEHADPGCPVNLRLQAMARAFHATKEVHA